MARNRTFKNHFLRANKIIDIKKELAQLNGNSCWTFCITFMQANRPTGTIGETQGGQKKIDYKEVLPADVFEVYSSLSSPFTKNLPKH